MTDIGRDINRLVWVEPCSFTVPMKTIGNAAYVFVGLLPWFKTTAENSTVKIVHSSDRLHGDLNQIISKRIASPVL